ncbi:hypothetical protein [Cupriavidus plantarum]|uniref:hypothetical protein n=1 Tax=Cupriavidus plantarum TaxID=942865 RepID=UPI00339D5FED
MPKDHRYFGKTIDEHYDAGSCWLCGKSVEYSLGYHTPTGAHWDCVSALRSQLEDLATDRRTVPYLARANGGHYIHTVDPRTARSLCGHAPKDTARRIALARPMDRSPRRAARLPTLPALRAPGLGQWRRRV